MKKMDSDTEPSISSDEIQEIITEFIMDNI